jgi:hypothetical protein
MTFQRKAAVTCRRVSGGKNEKLHSIFENNINTKSPNNAIEQAALWYLKNRHDNATRFTPRIMDKFGLKPKQVVEAYRLAEQISKEVHHG